MKHWDFEFQTSVEAETEQEAWEKLISLANDDAMQTDIGRKDLWSLNNSSYYVNVTDYLDGKHLKMHESSIPVLDEKDKERRTDNDVSGFFMKITPTKTFVEENMEDTDAYRQLMGSIHDLLIRYRVENGYANESTIKYYNERVKGRKIEL